MGNIRQFSSDAFIYGLGTGLKKFIGFFLLPFYTRAISPSDFGILDTLSTFSFFVSAIIGAGIDSASNIYFFEAKTEKEKGEVLFTTFILRLLTAVPSILLSFFSADISKALFHTDDYAWLVFISCITIPATFVLSEQSQIYRNYRQPWKFNLLTMIKSLSAIILGITLVVIFRHGVLGALLASFFSTVLVAMFSFVYYTHRKYTYKFNWSTAKKMIILGYPLIWAGIAQWVYASSDRFFLLHYKNLTEIGYYSIGSTFSQPIGLISMAVHMSFSVLFLSIYNGESKENGKIFLSDIFRLYIMLAVVTASFLSIFSTSIVGMATTPAFLMGGLSIPLLTFSVIFEQGQQIVASGIYINKKTWHYGWLVSVSALTNIGLNFIFIPKWGFVGAGMTTLISYFVYFLSCYFVSQKYFRVNYRVGIILLYIFISFLIALFPPFAELKAMMQINVLNKLLLFSAIIILPFILGLMNLSSIVKLKRELIGRLKNAD